MAGARRWRGVQVRRGQRWMPPIAAAAPVDITLAEQGQAADQFTVVSADPQVVAVSSGNSGAGTYADGVAVPTAFEGGFTPLAGDLAIIRYGQGATTLTATIDSGYTDPSGGNPRNQGTNSRAYLWSKVLTASEAPPSITPSGGAATAGWDLVVLRGVAGVNRVADAGLGNTDTVTLPTLTAVVAGRLLVAFVHHRVAASNTPAASFTPDADYTERSDHGTSRPTSSQNLRFGTGSRLIGTTGDVSGDTWTAVGATAGVGSMIAYVAELTPTGTVTQDKSLFDVAAGVDSLQAAVQVPLPDAGTGSDQLQVAVTVPMADSGLAADILQVDQGATPKALTESGTATDQVQVAGVVALPDSAAAADQVTVAAQLLVPDSGTGTDVLQVDQGVPKTLPDSGTAADAIQVTAAVPLANQGQAADQTQISVAVALPDVGQAGDQLIIPKQLLETGTAANTLQVVAQITVPDSGMATEQATATAATLLSDSGTAADQLILAVYLADAGTGVDRLLPAAAVPLPESGAAADQFGTDQGAAAGLADQATAADQLQVTLGKLLGDQATAADSLVLAQTRTLTDTATAADTLTSGVVAAPADQAAAADRLTLLALARLPDSGQALDALVVVTVSTYLRTSSREPAMATSSREQGHLLTPISGG